MSTTSRKIVDISDKKKLLLKHLLQKEAAAKSSQQDDTSAETYPTILPRTNRETYPLSFTQQQFWKMEQFAPAEALVASLSFAGQLDQTILRQCMQMLLERHEILRAVFPEQDGSPVQHILPVWPVALDYSDLSDHEPEAIAQAVTEMKKASRAHAFDLAHGPLFHAALVSLSSCEHLFCLAIHPLLADYETLALLCHELATLYQSESCEHQHQERGMPSITYADYASWQCQYFQAPALEEQRHYWQRQLDRAPLTLNLPLDHSRSADVATVQMTFTQEIDPALTQQLIEFCERERFPLEHCLFAAFSLLLSRYTGQADIVIGASLTNRVPAVEAVAGPFATILPIRVQLAEAATGQEFLRQIHQTWQAARRSWGLPLEHIVEAIYPQHDLTRVPLFQTAFGFQQVPSFAGLSAKLLPLLPALPLQDLSVFLQSSDQHLSLSIMYDARLFEQASIERLSAHYAQLLKSFVERPVQPLADFSCLTAHEQAQLLHAWNTALSCELPAAHLCLHHLFEQQAQRTPLAIALSDGQRQLTYDELNGRANQLAHLLRRRGVGPGQLVGLCLTRSFDLVIGLLAILKAGGAYVPLDPTYPQDRLAFTVQDARLNLVLTQQELLASMPFSSEQALCLDTPNLYSEESVENMHVEMSNEHLAYVIYTSGSTGRPKGVCICHRSAVVFIQWARQEFSDEELAGVLAGTSVCFDLSIFELFAPLSWGGRVILVPSVLDLPQLATHERITLLNTVPSAATALLNNGSLPSSLLTINLAGEALARDLVQDLYHQTSIKRVCNLYGPTEDTTYSTWATIGRHEQGAVTIGRPLPNTQAYILDSQLRPVPIGVSGELYLGGAGQAHGYLHRPDLTAERFVPDPFSRFPGGRLYKTGDLARYRPDGSIDYLGRLDHQVKVRGFRIELGEIETHLRQHPDIADVVVVAMESGPGEKHLVAYLVMRSQRACDTAELRQYLQALVPSYMVPSFFIPLKQLPQTANGKIDRKALPNPYAMKMQARLSPQTMPRGKCEQQLALLWQEILHIATVGRNDDFFLCGGDSLRATRLLARIQRDFQTSLSLADIFAAPTIAQLAEKLQAIDTQPAFEPVPSVRDVSVPPDAPSPLAFAQQRLWFIDQMEQGTALYNVPLVLALSGPLHRLALYQALREIVRRHEPLRSTIYIHNGSPFLHISDLCVPAFTFLDMASTIAIGEGEAEESIYRHPQVLHEIQQEVQRIFDLAVGPLFRVRLLRLRAERHVLIITAHHTVVDGWSLTILAEELGQLYSAFSAGRPSPLPDVPVRYRDFVAWQRNHQARLFASDLQYWKERFSSLPPVLDLPTDYPRPLVQSFEGQTQRFQFSLELTQQLLAVSQQEGTTLFMTLLTAFVILLAHYAHQEDFVVGTSVANRSQPELEALVGCFVNTLALRIDLSRNPTGRELLHRVKATALDAYSHQDVPFEQVVEAIQPPRDPSRSPLFQVFFLLQNVPSATVSLSDLRVQPIDVSPPTSQFDLSFFLEEDPTGLRLMIEYNTQLFAASTIERLQTCYQTILSVLSTQLEAQVQEIALLSENEELRQERMSNESRKPLLIERTPRVPEKRQSSDASEGDMLQSSVEEKLARIWEKVLKVPLVERTENFFEIGGHSLLAMQMLATVREELEVTISIRQFFTVPTLVSLAALIEQEQLRQQAQPEMDMSIPPLVRVKYPDELPLSFAQQRLWFLDQLEGSSATYNIPVVLHLTGELHLPVLQRCIREIVRRHETLRTTFPKGQIAPVQYIHLLPLTNIEVVDFSSDESEERQKAILQDIQTEVQRPFDLANGPLLRTRILRLGRDQHIVIFVMHHIISDGWSMDVLARELNALYNAFLAGEPSPLPELSIQYGDFVIWQRQNLQGPRLAAHLAYWRQQLTGVPTLRLPLDHPRQLAYCASGAHCSVQWSDSFAQEVLAFCQQENVTLFMTLLAAFQALLGYYSGQDDIIVGTPVANRSHPALELLVGFFVNTLALRTRLDGNPTGRELLQRVRDVTLGAYDHQDVPFEQVVEAVHPERQPGLSPLFQVLFVLQNNAKTSLALANVQTKALEMHTATAKFDLSVGAEINDDGLGLGIEYNTQIFERATVQRMLAHYRILLEQFIACPETRLAELYELLSGTVDAEEK